jgi:hypothetical protein
MREFLEQPVTVANVLSWLVGWFIGRIVFSLWKSNDV